MNRLEIRDFGISVDVPATFAEMSRDQVLYIAKQLYSLQRGEITLSDFRLLALYKLVGLRHSMKSVYMGMRDPARAMELAETIVLLEDKLLGELFTESDGRLTPAFNTVTNPLPTIRIGWRRLIGPADGLMDISFEELIAADAELAQYVSSHDETYIDRMMATLYRRSGKRQPCGRYVEPFDIERTERNVRLFRRVPAWKKHLFLMWYAASVENLQKGSFNINGREVTFAPLFGEESSGKSLGWLGTLFDLSERKTFGGIKETAEANVIDVLSLLLNDKYHADYVESHYKTH